MARSLESLEPFSVDCDVRWIKRQAKGSMGFTLYMEHVLAQAMNIIGHQHIDTLFTTPPLLVALAGLMRAEDRQRIQGIHTGGIGRPHVPLQIGKVGGQNGCTQFKHYSSSSWDTRRL